jgi:hypothetical protein
MNGGDAMHVGEILRDPVGGRYEGAARAGPLRAGDFFAGGQYQNRTALILGSHEFHDRGAGAMEIDVVHIEPRPQEWKEAEKAFDSRAVRTVKETWADLGVLEGGPEEKELGLFGVGHFRRAYYGSIDECRTLN